MIAGSTLRAVRARAHSAGRRRGGVLVAVLALLAALTGAGCGNETSGGAAESTKITVFAAASLTSAFTELGDAYSAAHQGTEVTFNFAGSQDLVAQLKQGAPADVLATADTKTMDMVTDLVNAPATFAGNKLAIAVAPGNPKGIENLADLAEDGLVVVLAAPEVPAGTYAAQILATSGVTVKPASWEDTVKGVVTKVSLGEADAGIVYVTDVTAAAGKVDAVTIPDPVNVVATYPIAVVKARSASAEAQAFVDFVLSAEGQATLAGFGFLAPPAK